MTNWIIRLDVTWLFLFLFSASNSITFAQPIPNPLSVIFPHEWIGDIDDDSFPEPSGISFHPSRSTLFVVGDEGHVGEYALDGTRINMKHVISEDFEGITNNPETGLLYIAVEGEESILELDPDDFSIKRNFPINRRINGELVMKEGGEGIEAIVFVPDTTHPHGGTFLVANQSFKKDNPNDESAIYEVEVPLKQPGEPVDPARIIRRFTPGVIDLAALHFDSTTDHIFALSDSTNSIIEMDRNGTLININAFPGDNQEGLTGDNDGNLYIAQDSGGIIHVVWKRPQ